MSETSDVIIVGGGIVGLTAALAMASRNFSVAVIDAGPLVSSITALDPRVFAVNRASSVLFEQLDVWHLIDDQQKSPYRHMHVWDSKSGGCIDFDARLVASSELGFIIAEAAIKQALLQRVGMQSNIRCFPANSVRNVACNDDLVTVTSDKQVWQSSLLMVADGGESPTRKLLKIPITTWPYHQHALVATVRTEEAHQQTARQVFNPDGPLAFLPLIDAHHCSIVWSTTPKRALQLSELAEEDFNLELTKAFAHKLGNVTLESKRFHFPLTMRHSQRYSGNNWLLLGDAAHTIHPLAGLGLNLGLADVASCMSLLDSSATVNKKMLGMYQRERKSAVWQTIALMGGLKTLFANPLPPITVLRGLGLDLCNRLTPLKRLLIEQAAGTSLHRL